MLSEHGLELLTAFTDGELTRRQRKTVLSLLHRSSEARSILRELQKNAHRVHELPQRELGESFAGRVLRTIAERGLRPAPRPDPLLGRRAPRWVGYAAAACVTAAVGMAIYFTSKQSPVDPDTVVAVKPHPEPVRNFPLHVSFKELAHQPKR